MRFSPSSVIVLPVDQHVVVPSDAQQTRNLLAQVRLRNVTVHFETQVVGKIHENRLAFLAARAERLGRAVCERADVG